MLQENTLKEAPCQNKNQSEAITRWPKNPVQQMENSPISDA